MPVNSQQLAARFQAIFDQRMRDLPFVNPELAVEAVGFRRWQDLELGILITPWFMNLILLPMSDANIEQGHKLDARFPSGKIEFTAAQDDQLGLFFSAALFSSVMSFPDQETAVDIATEVLRELLANDKSARLVSRRAIFTAAGGADA